MNWEFTIYKHQGFSKRLYLLAKHAGTKTETVDARWIERELCCQENELKTLAEQWGFMAESDGDYTSSTFYIIFGVESEEVRLQANQFIEEVLMPMATMSMMIKGE